MALAPEQSGEDDDMRDVSAAASRSHNAEAEAACARTTTRWTSRRQCRRSSAGQTRRYRREPAPRRTHCSRLPRTCHHALRH
jgi:hypothetical protein